jgi:hypothetical protein
MFLGFFQLTPKGHAVRTNGTTLTALTRELKRSPPAGDFKLGKRCTNLVVNDVMHVACGAIA